jgi:hypothetical protein
MCQEKLTKTQEKTMKTPRQNGEKVTKLLDLKRVIGQIVSEEGGIKFPQVIMFNRGIEYTQYRITIEEIDEDFFIDSKGEKWMKIKET